MAYVMPGTAGYYYISGKNLLLTYRDSMFNLLDITSKFRTNAMFITYCIHAQFVCMFMTYFHNEFHVPSSDCSLIITVKLKADDNFCMAIILLFYILYKNSCIFFKYPLPYTTSGPRIKCD
jgi:hypothetical protein